MDQPVAHNDLADLAPLPPPLEVKDVEKDQKLEVEDLPQGISPGSSRNLEIGVLELTTTANPKKTKVPNGLEEFPQSIQNNENQVASPTANDENEAKSLSFDSEEESSEDDDYDSSDENESNANFTNISNDIAV